MRKGKNIAVRPNAIIEARYDLTAKQNDILDMVLSEINDDDTFLYEIDINKYSQLYANEFTRNNIYRDFKKSIKEFEGKGFRIIDNKNNKEMFFVWFASIRYLDGEGRIVVELGKALKGLLVEMKKRVFYKIEYPLNFKSVYSKRIYYYLLSFKDTGWRVDNLDELRAKLQCPKSYNKYGLFRTKVLDVAQEEISNYSDINFIYEEIKTGRKVTGIKFYISSNNQIKTINTTSDEIAITMDPVENIKEITVNDEEEVLPGQTDFDFFIKNKLQSLIAEQLTDKDIDCLLQVANGDIEKIEKAYEVAKNNGSVKNLVAFMVKAIKHDWEVSKIKKVNNKFNNFKQRNDWDFEILEKLEREKLIKDLENDKISK